MARIMDDKAGKEEMIMHKGGNINGPTLLNLDPSDSIPSIIQGHQALGTKLGKVHQAMGSEDNIQEKSLKEGNLLCSIYFFMKMLVWNH